MATTNTVTHVAFQDLSKSEIAGYNTNNTDIPTKRDNLQDVSGAKILREMKKEFEEISQTL